MNVAIRLIARAQAEGLLSSGGIAEAAEEAVGTAV